MAQDSSKAFFHCFNFPPSARESCIFPRVFRYLNFPLSHSLLSKSCIFPPRVPFRVGHADIFADAHQCGYLHYPTYVGYSAIYAAHISDRHPIRIRMAIPSLGPNCPVSGAQLSGAQYAWNPVIRVSDGKAGVLILAQIIRSIQSKNWN